MHSSGGFDVSFSDSRIIGVLFSLANASIAAANGIQILSRIHMNATIVEKVQLEW
jgi:hypothetical protein